MDTSAKDAGSVTQISVYDSEHTVSTMKNPHMDKSRGTKNGVAFVGPNPTPGPSVSAKPNQNEEVSVTHIDDNVETSVTHTDSDDYTKILLQELEHFTNMIRVNSEPIKTQGKLFEDNFLFCFKIVYCKTQCGLATVKI